MRRPVPSFVGAGPLPGTSATPCGPAGPHCLRWEAAPSALLLKVDGTPLTVGWQIRVAAPRAPVEWRSRGPHSCHAAPHEWPLLAYPGVSAGEGVRSGRSPRGLNVRPQGQEMPKPPRLIDPAVQSAYDAPDQECPRCPTCKRAIGKVALGPPAGESCACSERARRFADDTAHLNARSMILRSKSRSILTQSRARLLEAEGALQRSQTLRPTHATLLLLVADVRQQPIASAVITYSRPPRPNWKEYGQPYESADLG